MSLVLVMLTGLVVFLIVSPPLAIVHLLLAILLLGAIKRRMLLLVLVLKVSIELWRIPLLRCYGFRLSFVTLVLIFLFLCRGIVTIRPPSLLLTIPCSIPIPMQRYRTKHIEVDCHFIWDLLMKKQIVTHFVH